MITNEQLMIFCGAFIAIIIPIIRAIKPIEHLKKWLPIALDKLGQAMTRGVIEEVKVINGAMEQRIRNDFDSKIQDITEKVELYKEEGAKRDIFTKADRLHDDILINADKMRFAHKFPGEERAKVLYDKVLQYRKICATYPDEYHNGVCDVACDYIEEWFIDTYRNPNKKKEEKNNGDTWN